MKQSGPIDRNHWQYTEWTAPPPERVWFWNRTGVNPSAWVVAVLAPIACLAILFGVAFLISKALLSPDIASPIILLLIPLTVVIPVIALHRMSRAPRSGIDVRDLMDLPQTVPQYPVRVTYKIGGTRYGRDVGVLSFTGSLVYFQGRRSRFSFSNSAILSAGVGESVSHGQTELQYAFEQARLQVEIRCFDSTPGIGSGFQAMFADELKKWRACPRFTVTQTVLPPLKAEARVVGQARLQLTATVTTMAAWAIAIAGFAVTYPAKFGTLNGAMPALSLLLFGITQLRAARLGLRNLKLLKSIDEDRPAAEPKEVSIASDVQLQQDPHRTSESTHLQIRETS